LAFPSSRRNISRPPRLTLVLAVGQRVFVHSLDSPTRPVALGDETGILSGEHVIDGLEVEVMAWRPRGPTDTRYRVRTPGGVDGWLAAGNLRKSRVAPPAPSSPASAQMAVPAAGNVRPFGQRSHVGTHAPATLSPPASASAARGRRFGERF
jgi:hypothetical protein